jgi:transmembrane sensor
MSALETGNASNAPDAMAIEHAAADWVEERRNVEDWTVERQAELDAWLAKSLAHRVAFVRIEATWRRTDRLAALHRPVPEQTDTRLPRKSLWTRVAFTAGLAAVTGLIGANYIFRAPTQLIATPVGGHRHITLADGSQIELNTDTAVRIDLTKKKRVIELVKGEAYFEIHHDGARPFIVTVADHRIVDLGTKFLVRTTPELLKVTLVEGRARLEGANSEVQQQAIVLAPGDLAVATGDSVSVSRRRISEIANTLAWRQGTIVLSNASLADAAAEFNRYGGPPLIVADRDAAKMTINGTFRTNAAEEFAGMTHEIFGLRVEHQNGSIVLSR